MSFAERYDLALSIEDDHEARKIAARSWSDVIAIDHIRRQRRPKIERFDWEPTTEWHKEIVELNDIIPNNRKIMWYYEERGCTGKSAISKYMGVKFGKRWVSAGDMGTSRDAATIISRELSRGWKCHGIIINLPRQCSNHTRMYEYIENLKDGAMTAQKYEGENIMFDSPHIVVFANFAPVVAHLSLDRWDIKKIQEDGTSLKIDTYSLLNEQLEEYNRATQRTTFGSFQANAMNTSPIYNPQ